MLFTSVAFLLFAAITLLCYFTVPKRTQWWVLLASSLVFYALAGIEYTVFILYTATVTYLTSRILQSRADAEDAFVEANRDTMDKASRKAYRASAKKKRFVILVAGLLLGFGMLAVLKYTAFVMEGISSLSKAVGQNRKNKLRLSEKYAKIRFAEDSRLSSYEISVKTEDGENKCI